MNADKDKPRYVDGLRVRSVDEMNAMRGNAGKDKATAYLRDSTPRPWHRDEYGHVRGPEGEMISLTGFSLATGHVPRDSQPYHNDALVFAAVNSFDAHRQLAEAAQKAADTFADFERTLGMLGRKPVAEAAHIAGEALRAALAAVDAVEKP